NTGSRFLIPAAPFAAMALGIALESIPAALPLSVVFAGLLAWPPVVSLYCDSFTWRIGEFPIREALRKEDVSWYILKYQPDAGLNRALNLYTAPADRIFSFAGRPDAYLDRDIIVSYESALGNLVNDILWNPQAHPPDFRQRFRFLPVDALAVRVVNNATSDNFWTVAEMRVFSQAREVPRGADWRIRAYPNSWEAPLAFDNSYATRWSTWEGMRPGAHLEIDFPRPTRIDAVMLECEPAWDARLQVNVKLPAGRWVPITDTAELEKVDTPEGLRRAAARDVKALGIRYLLVNEGDFVYQDFNRYLRFWGLTQLTEMNGTHLYRID
ncbi:MAG: discoidin domain-containing protein, partial [Acidobacteriota bacterium]|nr:discoidin domain-containing protein [Acidobacteriota bacterium]